MHMHIVLIMTKVISLSNEAYLTLKNLKKSGESFSDVVLRVAGERKRSQFLSLQANGKAPT